MTAKKPDDYLEPKPADIAAGHEVSDVQIGGLITFLAGLVISLLATVVFVTWLFNLYQKRFDAADPAPSPLAGMRVDETVPGPHLQQSPRTEMEALRDKDRKILDSAAWLDEQKRIAREPIEMAMEQVARDGLPKWPRVAEATDAKSKDDR